MKRQEWKEKAAEMSGVPKDVAMGLPILTITGTNDLCVEVIYYTNDEMKIHGHIRTIEYQL